MQACLYEYLRKKEKIEQLIVLDDKEASLAESVCRIFDFKTFVLPDIRVFYGDDIRTFSDEFFKFNFTLYSYYKYDGKKILISPLATSLLPFVEQSLYKRLKIIFANDIHDDIKETLFLWGYEFVDLVEVKGEVSFRGDIIDISYK